MMHRRFVVATVAVLVLGWTGSGRGAGGLETKSARKAAIACQKALAHAEVRAAKLRGGALELCAAGALDCLLAAKENERCLPAVVTRCATKLGKSATALATLVAKLGANAQCSTLQPSDFFRPDGLALGALVSPCRTFGLDICTGFGSIAECVVRASSRAAAESYGRGVPRTFELLDLLGTTPPASTEGLPAYAGCGNCAVPLADRSRVDDCGTVLRKAFTALEGTLRKALVACAQKAFGCEQSSKDVATCRADTAARCTARTESRIVTALAKFRTAFRNQKCAPVAVDFARVLAEDGLNYRALEDECAALGIPAIQTPTHLAECLERRATCGAAARARLAIPRAADIGAAGLGSEIAARLAESCPDDAGTTPLTTAAAQRAERANVFGSIIKIIKAVRRPSLTGVRLPGVPSPRRFAPRSVTVDHPPRFGPLTKIPVKVHYNLGAAARTSARAAATSPPQLILTLTDGDGEADHFELDLDPTPLVNTIDVELEFQDFRTCAFTLGFATRVDGEVSAYTPVVFVPDADVPRPTTPTPTASPAATGSPTSTATATPTGTVTPTPTLTVTATRTPTPTRTATPTPTPTTTPPAALRVFVTSTSHTGTLGGLTGADAICNARAAAAGLGGTYKAWLSDTFTTAGSRLTRAATIPYRRIDGTLLAVNWGDLTDGSLASALTVDEFGQQVPAATYVWTGSTANGSTIGGGPFENGYCGEWTWDLDIDYGQVGSLLFFTSPEWSAFQSLPCNTPNRLYCFEQSTVVPTVVPTPTPTATKTPTPTPTKTPVCGNGVIEPPETCEPPGGFSLACPVTAACGSDCKCVPPPVCGNGICEDGEACDPPNCGPVGSTGCCCADCGCGAGCGTLCSGGTAATRQCVIP